MKLSELQDTNRKSRKRVGRGRGTGLGKTAGRGHKGYGSRNGMRRRYGQEGGQFPLYRKVPCRGFTRGRFLKPFFSINLDKINALYNEGEVVSLQTLQEKGHLPKNLPAGLKILSRGNVEKKIRIEAHAFSSNAQKKLDDKKIEYKVIGKK